MIRKSCVFYVCTVLGLYGTVLGDINVSHFHFVRCVIYILAYCMLSTSSQQKLMWTNWLDRRHKMLIRMLPVMRTAVRTKSRRLIGSTPANQETLWVSALLVAASIVTTISIHTVVLVYEWYSFYSGHTRCAVDRTCAEERSFIHNKWGTDCDGDGQVLCDDYARMHKAGRSGCSAAWILDTPYWNEYVQCMHGGNRQPKIDARRGKWNPEYTTRRLHEVYAVGYSSSSSSYHSIAIHDYYNDTHFQFAPE